MDGRTVCAVRSWTEGCIQGPGVGWDAEMVSVAGDVSQGDMDYISETCV